MTFTKEQLIEQAKSSIERYSKAVVGFPRHLNVAMDLELARIALASLEAEPVITVGDDGGDALAYRRLIQTFAPGTKLFTAPPAPVVEDIGEISVGRLPTMNQDDYPGLGDWWVQLRTGKDSDEVLARVYGATPQEANSRAEALACRAAMLQGADGNSPVIPDGWKLVPVEPTKEMIDAGWSYYMTTKSPSSLGVYGAMLAAAPQQEVK